MEYSSRGLVKFTSCAYQDRVLTAHMDNLMVDGNVSRIHTYTNNIIITNQYYSRSVSPHSPLEMEAALGGIVVISLDATLINSSCLSLMETTNSSTCTLTARIAL